MFTAHHSPWNLLEAFTSAFEDAGRLGLTSHREQPAVNVWTNDDTVAVSAELPGVEPDNLTIEVEGDTLTLSGKRTVSVAEGARAVRRERGDLTFTRSIRLPFAVEAKQAHAEFRNGVLLISLNRLAATKPKRIAVTAH